MIPSVAPNSAPPPARFGRLSPGTFIRPNKKYPAAIKTDEKGDPISEAVGTQALGTDISRGYTEQLEHWAWCIRDPDPKNHLKCHPKVALADAVIALTTNIAAHGGRKIDFKPEWFDPKSDATPEGIKPDVKRYS
jgi:hypothetical protein